MKAFGLLQHFKGLRGTKLDPFGKTEERKMERQLIEDYLHMLRGIGAGLNENNLDIAIALARLPDDIRGYGHIKEDNMRKAAAKKESLLKDYAAASLSKVA